MDFSLTDEQKMIQQTVRRFVERELMPLENEVLQSEGKYPTGVEPELYHTLQTKAKDLGFWGINTPEEYGGANLGAVAQPVFRCDADGAGDGELCASQLRTVSLRTASYNAVPLVLSASSL